MTYCIHDVVHSSAGVLCCAGARRLLKEARIGATTCWPCGQQIIWHAMLAAMCTVHMACDKLSMAMQVGLFFRTASWQD
jgi:hypothetical protein